MEDARMQTTYNSDKRKILSAVSHGSIFFSALVLTAGIPIAIWFISDDSVVKDNAREALNFHLNIWVYGIIFGILAWILIGYLFLGVLFLVQIIMPILAVLNILGNPDNVYRYPFIFRPL